MNRPLINDAGIDREMTESEFAEYRATISDIELREQEAAAVKTSAKNKLLALGLTDDEIASLGV